MLYFWLFLVFIGTLGTGLNITDGNESYFPIPLQVSLCLVYFCMFIRSAIREGR